MADYKIGNKVKIVSEPDSSHVVGDVGTIVSFNAGSYDCRVGIPNKGIIGSYNFDEIELVEREKKMARRTFRLKKNSPELLKGTLVQEACDDGNQEYEVLNIKEAYRFDDWSKYFSNPHYSLSRNAVEQNDDWFEEVFAATPEWLTEKELDEFREYRNRKPVNTAPAQPIAQTGKYAWLTTLNVNSYKDIAVANRRDRKNLSASMSTTGKHVGHKYTSRTIANGKVRVTRVA